MDGDDENDEAQGEPTLGPRQLSRNQVIAMISNFSTSYNAVNVGLVLPVLQYSVSVASGGGSGEYSSPDDRVAVQRLLEDDEDDEEESIVASSLLAGMIIGQLIGGFLGDSLGRRRAMTLVMIMQIGGSIGSAIFVTTSESAMNELAIWRFVLGIGAGGVYPLAAVMSAEDREEDECESNEASEASDNQKSIESFQRIAMTFSTQGLGFLTVPLLAWPMLAFRMSANAVWRTLLGLGALPGLIVLYLRIAGDSCSKIRGEALAHVEDPDDGQSNLAADGLAEVADPDNELALIDNSHLHGRDPNSLEFDAIPDDPPQPERQGEHRGLWESIKSEPQLKRKLAGTAGAWFLFDVLFYGNTLFEPLVLEAAFGAGSSADGYEQLQSTVRDSLVISLLSLPGYFITVLLIGRRTCTCRSLRTNSRCSAICPPIYQTPSFIQLQGFFLMFVLYLTIGLLWHRLSEVQWLLILLYASTFFFSNYGPNSTTFLLPSVTYSKECRSTLNGISAACGKAGALVGASLFAPASDILGEQFVMISCGCVSLLGWLLTKLFVPSNTSS